jgi:hypothetical protein
MASKSEGSSGLFRFANRNPHAEKKGDGLYSGDRAVIYSSAEMTIGIPVRRASIRGSAVAVLAVCALTMMQPLPILAQIKGQPRAAAAPPWNRGIVPISPESYYNAIECGKQGGADPPCVFWDTGLCKNDDFVLAMYTPYKQVAYEVWVAVSKKQPVPQPSYPAAQRTHVTIGVTQAPGSKNVLTDLVLKRGGKSLTSVDRSLTAGGGRFTFDFPAFAVDATTASSVTLDLVGKSKTVSCTIDAAALRQFR